MLRNDRLEEIYAKNPYLMENLEPLDPLPYPVYFVTKNSKWQDLIKDFPSSSLDSFYERCTQGHDIWSVQAYLDLKQRGLNVHLVSQPVPGQICIIPYYYLSPKDLLFRSYVVACQHDTPYPHLCDRRIVLNHLQVFDEEHYFMPHRPQPQLKPRNPARGTLIRNLVFKGHEYNLFAPFRSEAFVSELTALGINLAISSQETASLFSDWCDYTEADVVLAVRNNTKYDIALKPALKLINAWFAGCPAILGPEPAYQALRQSELDYIEVRQPEEAIAALKYLQANPDVYVAMIENGFRRAQEFTPDRIAQHWHSLLAGPIAQGYEQWLRQSRLHKQIVRPVRFAWQGIRHKAAHRYYLRHIQQGQRLLSAPSGS